MKKTTKPKEYVPQYSANFVVGFSFLHHALAEVSEAFMSKASK